MDTTLPRLRPIEAHPVEADGKRLIYVRDPLDYAAGPLLVPEEAFFVVAQLDGAHSLADIQRAFSGRYGQTIAAEEIEALIATLDGHHYLESGAFAVRRAAVDGAFRQAAERPAAHAGSSYPSDATELTEHLSSFFIDLPPLATAAGPLTGLIAPHIDLRVGGRSYGHAYRALQETSHAERYLILGTSHLAGTSLFAATRKDFTTPFGTATTDRAFLDRLATHAPGDLFHDEILHRIEHAIEFQVVMLQHVLGARPFTIVPILVTSFHEFVQGQRSPAGDPRVADMIDAVRTTVAEDDVPTAIIAGVDFAHVGEKFGDRGGLDADLLATTEAKDRRLLAALESADAERFFAEVAADRDRTRVCGLSPMYTFLRLIDDPGRVLHYDRSDETATRSAVSYASLAFGLEGAS